DRLFGRARPVLALADVMHFLAHELARLGRRGFPLAAILRGTSQRFLFGHGALLVFDGSECTAINVPPRQASARTLKRPPESVTRGEEITNDAEITTLSPSLSQGSGRHHHPEKRSQISAGAPWRSTWYSACWAAVAP